MNLALNFITVIVPINIQVSEQPS